MRSKQALHVKPPIVVRDFALELGLKPFKLISELMEMGIFASMNQTIEESTAKLLASRHGFELKYITVVSKEMQAHRSLRLKKLTTMTRVS